MVRTRSLSTFAPQKANILILAEWAIARLQVEARHSKSALPQQASGDVGGSSHKESLSSSPDHESDIMVDIGKYHCTSQSHHGNLHVSSTGVRYVTAVRSTLLWKVQFDECKTIRKRSDSGLIFELMDDGEFQVMGLGLRNEVFTQIVGYSGLAWQVTG